LWAHYERIIKDKGIILLMASEPFATKLRMSNFANYKYDIYWLKNRPTGMSYARFQPMRRLENICVFYKKQPTYNPIKTARSDEELKRLSKRSIKTAPTEAWEMSGGYGKTANRYDNQFKNPTNVLEFKCVANQGKEKVAHPTQKPIALFDYLIKTYTNEGDIVLDNCIGSGTTAVAALNTGRKFIGFETEPAYIEIANKRIDDLQ
jgi:site-specific DNA-methyltransferase (adenine-specific)